MHNAWIMALHVPELFYPDSGGIIMWDNPAFHQPDRLLKFTLRLMFSIYVSADHQITRRVRPEELHKDGVSPRRPNIVVNIFT
jgi:hypothetical protein